MNNDQKPDVDRLIERAHLAMLRANYEETRKLLNEVLALSSGNVDAVRMLRNLDDVTHRAAIDPQSFSGPEHEYAMSIARSVREEYEQRQPQQAARDIFGRPTGSPPWIDKLTNDMRVLMPKSILVKSIPTRTGIPIVIGSGLILACMRFLIPAILSWRQSGPSAMVNWQVTGAQQTWEDAQSLAWHAGIVGAIGIVILILVLRGLRRSE